MWPFWYHFVAILVCGRFCVWPFWFLVVLDVHPECNPFRSNSVVIVGL